MATFMELYVQIYFVLIALKHSIKETQGKYPGTFGPSPDDRSGTIIPTPEAMAALVEHMHQVGPLVDGLVIIATKEWQKELAVRHKGKFTSFQNEVLQMLQDLKRLECAN